MGLSPGRYLVLIVGTVGRRYSEVRGREVTRLEAIAEACLSSKPGAWIFLNVANPIDKRLLSLTKGRFSFAGPGRNVGLLATTGARSGLARTTPLQFIADGERVLLVASAGGAPRDPDWARNLRKHATCGFLYNGVDHRYSAREATGDERERVWVRAVDWYQGYAVYQTRTSRKIPVFILEPSGSTSDHP